MPFVADLAPNLLLVIVALFLLRTVINGAPYFPTQRKSVKRMLELAELKPGMKVVDLGSGDGRIVLAFGLAGAEAHGYEVNPLLVWYSRWQIKKAGLKGKCFVHYKSFWPVDLSDFDVVTVFGISGIMEKLEKKLQTELRPGAKVLSHLFKFPNWKAETEDEANSVRRYVKE